MSPPPRFSLSSSPAGTPRRLRAVAEPSCSLPPLTAGRLPVSEPQSLPLTEAAWQQATRNNLVASAMRETWKVDAKWQEMGLLHRGEHASTLLKELHAHPPHEGESPLGSKPGAYYEASGAQLVPRSGSERKLVCKTRLGAAF